MLNYNTILCSHFLSWTGHFASPSLRYQVICSRDRRPVVSLVPGEWGRSSRPLLTSGECLSRAHPTTVSSCPTLGFSMKWTLSTIKMSWSHARPLLIILTIMYASFSLSLDSILSETLLISLISCSQLPGLLDHNCISFYCVEQVLV